MITLKLALIFIAGYIKKRIMHFVVENGLIGWKSAYSLTSQRYIKSFVEMRALNRNSSVAACPHKQYTIKSLGLISHGHYHILIKCEFHVSSLPTDTWLALSPPTSSSATEKLWQNARIHENAFVLTVIQMLCEKYLYDRKTLTHTM